MAKGIVFNPHKGGRRMEGTLGLGIKTYGKPIPRGAIKQPMVSRNGPVRIIKPAEKRQDANS